MPAAADQEIEVHTLVGLQDVLAEQAGIAPLGLGSRGGAIVFPPASSAGLTSKCKERAGTSKVMKSPVRTRANGPPRAASGATCNTTVP